MARTEAQGLKSKCFEEVEAAPLLWPRFRGHAGPLGPHPFGHNGVSAPPPIQGTEIRAPVLMETSRHGSGRASGRGGLAAAILGKLESAAASQREGMV